MIRLNGFFRVPVENRQEFLSLAKELVEKSRKDAGNHFYSLVEDTYDPSVMMFVETWEDDASLKAHSSAEHFTRIVPRLKALTSDGMSLERFDY